MKSWLLFGFGMFLGIFLGAVGASFFLYDDVTHAAVRSPRLSANVSSSARRPSMKEESSSASVAATAPDLRPPSVPAQAVDLSTLSDVDAAIMSTARQDAPPSSPAGAP